MTVARGRAKARGLARIAGPMCFLITAVSVGPGWADDTHILINFTETHDRLGADPQSNIFRAVAIEATLTSDGHVHEHDVSGTNGGRRKRALTEGQSEGRLGDNSANVVWHVKGPHSLQRLSAGKQFLSVANVEIGADNTCAVEVKFLLQTGHADVVMRRRDNGELDNFTLPKVVNSSCAIK